MYGRLAGVGAKIERATQQLSELNRDVGATLAGLGGEPFAITTSVGDDGLPTRFKLDPRWDFDAELRWGVILGEIVHDLRSALDHVVWQLVTIGTEEPDLDNAFPLFEVRETPESFRARACRPATANRKHGPLFGVPADAVPVIEACQPYHGADTFLLKALHDLWSVDKHRDLLPVVLVAEPRLSTRDARWLSPPIATPVGLRSHVVSVQLEPAGPDPHADLDTGERYDLAVFGEPVIDRLVATARFILTAIVGPLYQRFPQL